MQRNLSRMIYTSFDNIYFRSISNSLIIKRQYSNILPNLSNQQPKLLKTNSIALNGAFFSMAADSKANIEKPATKKTEINFEELRELVQASIGKIYDVRELEEIKESSMIATAINLPLSKLKVSLKMDEDEFSKTYSVSRPHEQDEIIFYGLSSVKSLSALEIAHKLGYKKARHYPGGFEEWLKKHSGEH